MNKHISEKTASAPKKNISFAKRLAFTYSFFLMIVLLVSFGLYTFSADKVIKGIKNQAWLSLSSGGEDVIGSLQTINTIVSQISGSSDFVDFALSEDTDARDYYVRASKAQRALLPLIALEKTIPVNRGYIYLKNTDYFISYSYFTGNELFYSGTLSYKKAHFEEWQNFLSSDHSLYSMTPVSTFLEGSKDYIYCVPLNNTNAFNFQKIPAILCYEFSYSKLRNYFSDINLYDSGYIAAVSGDGHINFVLSSENLYVPSKDVYALEHLSYDGHNASFTDKNTKKAMLATRFVSSYGWTFYLVQPQERALYSFSTYKNIYAMLLFASVLLGVVLVYIFSIFNAKPVIELSHELDQEKAVSTDLNELVQKHRPIVNESFVRRIMEGSVNIEGEMEYITDALGLHDENVKYNVLYIKAFPSSDTIVHSDNMDLCIQNYDILVRDAISRYFPDTGYIYKPDDRNFAVLLSSREEQDFEYVYADIERKFTEMHNELLDHYGIWVNAGVGNRNGLLVNTWKSYQQAKDANSAATTDHFICNADTVVNVSADVYYYPESFALQLSGFITTGNKQQVDELFHVLARENTVSRHLSLYQMRWLINAVRTTLFKKRYHLPQGAADDPEKQHLLDLVDRQFEENLNLTSLKGIALTLCDVCGDSTEDSGNELINKVQEYITENFSDPGLCLTKISDEFSISENYFSFLFKKISGENFSVYLEKLRMAKAKELVIGSSQPLSEIYTLVGYNNPASFRRAFKKIFGISPKEMRERGK